MRKAMFSPRSGFDLPHRAIGDPDSEEEILVELIQDVLCINCNNMIPIELIEAHSLKCENVTAMVQRIEQLDAMDYCMEKINGLDRQLQKFKTDTRLQPGDRIYVELLLASIEDIKAFDPSIFGQTKEIRSTLEKLISLLTTFKGCTIIFVIAERLKVLLLEFVRIYRDREIISQTQELKNIQLNLEVPKQLELPKETPSLQPNQKPCPETNLRPPMMPIIEDEEPKKQQSPKNEPQELDAPLSTQRAISQVSSDADSEVRSSVGSYSSSVSGSLRSTISDQLRLSDDTSNKIYTEAREQNVEQEKLVEDPNARRKRFYGSCLTHKAAYPTDHMAQQIQIAKLYKRSIAKNIDESKWDQFIQFELGNAERWVKKNKKKRRSYHN